MYYQPKLANGKLIKNPWNIRVFRALNPIAWPLEDNVTFKARLFDNFYWFLGLFIMAMHEEAAIRFMRLNFYNFDEFLACVPTNAIMVEIHVRAFQMGLVKEKFKRELLKKFYENIFISDLENGRRHAKIHKKLRFTRIVTFCNFASLTFLVAEPIAKFMNNIREPLYLITYGFDITPNHIFFFIVASDFWVGFFVVSFASGELSLVSQIVAHLNERFSMLREDLEDCAMELLKKSDSTKIAYEFQLHLRKIIQRNAELYKFGLEVQRKFSFRFFVWFLVSATLLCTCAFEVYLNPKEGIAFIFWSCGKLLELGTIGELGSTLTQTTDELDSMFYHSKWELIIERSTNRAENVRVMKMILIAMKTFIKPINLTGLTFFTVSLSTIMTIVQASFSYFTGLITLRSM